MDFLKNLYNVWHDHGLLSDTCNLDFTTIPYWGDDSHLENNWIGKRNKALSSMLAILAQDPDTGIIDYGNCDVLHKNQSAIVLEYLDFYKQVPEGKKNINYLVFDSKLTNYENLTRLDDQGIKFITSTENQIKVELKKKETFPDNRNDEEFFKLFAIVIQMAIFVAC